MLNLFVHCQKLFCCIGITIFVYKIRLILQGITAVVLTTMTVHITRAVMTNDVVQVILGLTDLLFALCKFPANLNIVTVVGGFFARMAMAFSYTL